MKENTKLNIKVIMGSTREGRFSDKAAFWINEEIKKHEGVAVEVLDLRDYAMPFFNEAITPSAKKEPYKNEAVARFTAKIAEADAFVVATPEYNHGVPAVLKNALDWVYSEWHNKPIAFVSYGTAGGARSVEHLRLTSIELKMVPIREAIQINGEKYFPVSFGKSTPEELFLNYTEKAKTMITQLIWWASMLKNARNNLL
ncbi:MAG: NAD(P)H-dependent oxidoreductase [Candidatus Pacebacteria bacterium]|nr:NAD(P)H-dependent oxidoreductase [Candidatus Paceibacterota bacterium]